MFKVHGVRPLLAAITIVVAGPVHAQQSVSQRSRECAEAARVLAHGTPVNRRGWAMTQIRSCKAEAPKALAAALHWVDADTPDANQIFNDAFNLSDKDLLIEVLDMARNGASPQTRETGLVLLTHYTDPSVVLSAIGDIENPLQPVLSVMTDGDPVPGPQPLDASDRHRALEAIRQMGVDETNARLKLLATRVAKELDRYLAAAGS